MQTVQYQGHMSHIVPNSETLSLFLLKHVSNVSVLQEKEALVSGGL